MRSTTRVSHRSYPVERSIRRTTANSTASGSRIPGIRGRRRTSSKSWRLNKTGAATLLFCKHCPRLADTSGAIPGRAQVRSHDNYKNKDTHSAYCTTSREAIAVITGIAPLNLLAKERKYLHEKKRNPELVIRQPNILDTWQTE